MVHMPLFFCKKVANNLNGYLGLLVGIAVLSINLSDVDLFNLQLSL